MATNGEIIDRTTQIAVQMDAAYKEYEQIDSRMSNMVKDALIREGLISLPPDRILKFHVDEDRLSDEGKPDYELTISVGGSDFRLTVSQSQHSILYFSTSGISYRKPSDKEVSDTSEYYLVVSELLSNGPALVDQLIAVVSSFAEEREALRNKRRALYSEKTRIENEAREDAQKAEQEKLNKALEPEQVWLRQINSRYNWSLPAAVSMLMIDKVAGSSFTATEMTLYPDNDSIKDVDTKRFYRAGKTPAQVLTGGYVPTYLSYGEFQERIAEPDGKEWLGKLLGVKK